MDRKVDIEDALWENAKRFLGSLVSTVLGIFDFILNFHIADSKGWAIYGFKLLGKDDYIYMRIIGLHVLLSVFCLLIYYIYLRNWDLSDHQPSRKAFGWVFIGLGAVGLAYGLWKHWSGGDLKPLLFLIGSFIALLVTIGMTLSPGLVIFKKQLAKIARWKDRIRYA